MAHTCLEDEVSEFDVNSGLAPGTNLNGWYDLFSRGARDWLRHNEKVRDAVREHLPEIVAGADIVGGGSRTVRVPVKMLEHYHFRLRRPSKQQGVGQGAAKPGDVLAQPSQGDEAGKGAAGSGEGGIEFTLEFKVDDIVDWLWEEMQLPNLKSRVGVSNNPDWTREGLDKRGARSRLDRRRSMRESIKRRAVQAKGPQGEGPSFTDDDLRFRQLNRREQPSIQAVVFFLMDVSGSMTDRDRQLAKTFFFWATQGLKREYKHLDTVFVAHTTEAFEFDEEHFFKVQGSGGTVASTGLEKVREIIEERYNPARYNIYLFYASDGDNYTEDRPHAQKALREIAGVANYSGYLEVSGTGQRPLATETGQLFKEINADGLPAGSFALSRVEDVWDAIRHFFQHQQQEVA
jgi:sporulation protein YhbH